MRTGDGGIAAACHAGANHHSRPLPQKSSPKGAFVDDLLIHVLTGRRLFGIYVSLVMTVSAGRGPLIFQPGVAIAALRFGVNLDERQTTHRGIRPSDTFAESRCELRNNPDSTKNVNRRPCAPDKLIGSGRPNFHHMQVGPKTLHNIFLRIMIQPKVSGIIVVGN